MVSVSVFASFSRVQCFSCCSFYSLLLLSFSIELLSHKNCLNFMVIHFTATIPFCFLIIYYAFLSKNFKRRVLCFFQQFFLLYRDAFCTLNTTSSIRKKKHTHKTTTNILLTTRVSLKSIGIYLNRYSVVAHIKSRAVIYCKWSVVLENWNNCSKFCNVDRKVVKSKEFNFKFSKKWKY